MKNEVMFEVNKIKSELHHAYPNVIRPLNFYTQTQSHELSSDWLGPWIGTSQFKVPANESIVHKLSIIACPGRISALVSADLPS